MSKVVIDFWNGLASGDNYRDALVGWYGQHNEDPNERNILFRDIPLDGSLIALDFGCGPGRNMIKFKEAFKRIDGCDISQVILDKANHDLTQDRVPIPNLYHIDGHSLSMIKDNIYDVVFSIICLQHISCHDWRLELYKEFFRVLKPGGILTFQMGFGPGHGQSKDYFYNYPPEGEVGHYDVRVEDENALLDEIRAQGFVKVDHKITEPCHDQHPKWIWVRAEKPV